MLIIISSPSGGGKTTICKMLMGRTDSPIFNQSHFSISATTRPMRNGEKDGVDYLFLTREAFKYHIDAGNFLEYAEIHGNLYGTLIESVSTNKHTLFDIDYQGFLLMRAKNIKSISIFLIPPSLIDLEDRLKNRKDISEENIRVRIDNAQNEIAHAKLYDTMIVNNDIEETYTKVAEFINNNIDN